MKIKVLTLKNEECEIEVDEEEEINFLKKKIIKNISAFFNAENLKIIFAGKILSENQTISDCNIHNNDKIVAIATKSVTKNAAGSSSSSSTVNKEKIENENKKKIEEKEKKDEVNKKDEKKSEEKKNEANKSEEKKNEANKSEENKNEENKNEENKNEENKNEENKNEEKNEEFKDAASVLLTGDELARSIENIVNMGFEPEQVTVAMRAAFNNPDRAIEYLMNGLPEEVAAASDTSGNTTANTQSTGVGSGSYGGNEGIGNRTLNLQALREHPFFNELRSVVQVNPHLLPQLLNTIGQQYPDHYRIIMENQNELLEMLQEPIVDSNSTDSETEEATMDNSNSSNNNNNMNINTGNNNTNLNIGNNNNNMPPITDDEHFISLSPEEMEAVQRLENLGFSRDLVLQAYIACEKNADMAGNCLFEWMNDSSGQND